MLQSISSPKMFPRHSRRVNIAKFTFSLVLILSLASISYASSSSNSEETQIGTHIDDELSEEKISLLGGPPEEPTSDEDFASEEDTIYEYEDEKSKICYRGVYLNETGKCYQPNTRGPCGELMLVTELLENYKLGKCTCQTFEPAGPSKCETRPTYFWEPTNRCYFIFDQGPCNPGEWLVPTKKNGPTCKQIPCPEEYDAQAPLLKRKSGKPFLNFTFEHHGHCYSTRTQAFCGAKRYAFYPQYKMEPGCIKKGEFCVNSRVITGPSRSNKCGDGSQPDNYGGCQALANFD